MISFNFHLRNPWHVTFKNLWCCVFKTPFKNKFIELELTKDFSLLTVSFDWTVRQSHAGLSLELGIFGYNIHFNFYDNRHWDAETNNWANYHG